MQLGNISEGKKRMKGDFHLKYQVDRIGTTSNIGKERVKERNYKGQRQRKNKDAK